MRQLALVTLAVFCIQTGFSQNLVPNSSFEEQVPCEQFQSLLSNGSAEPWTTANAGSADVYNTDCIWAGSQNNGVCSAGIILLGGSPNYREYLQVELLDTLIAESKYCITFHYSRLSFTNSTDGLGFALTHEEVYQNNFLPLSVEPVWQNPENNLLTTVVPFDTISFEYIAAGGESHIIIGNFKTDEECNWGTELNEPQPYSYYYFDDIRVEPCDEIVHVEENELENGARLYPNPSSGKIRLNIPTNGSFPLRIYNLQGQVCLEEWVNGRSILDLRHLESGTYIVSMEHSGQLIQQRLILNH